MANEKLILVPLKEEYMPDPYTVFYARFLIGGVIPFDMNLIRADSLKLSKRVKKFKVYQHKYVCVMVLEKRAWAWFGSDDLDKASVMYKDVINKLKYGYEYVFEDLSHRVDPVRISHRGMEFAW